MDAKFMEDYCTVRECLSAEEGSGTAAQEQGDRLSVAVLYDQPFDKVALDEALFSLAIQDHPSLEVILVLPACGQAVLEQAEQALRAQAWPGPTRLCVVSVAVATSSTISASLLNAGLLHARGRYVAFLHHLDLVYQHAYKAILEQLRATDAAVVFGGVRAASHSLGSRHWMVTSKEGPKTSPSRLGLLFNERAPIHSFVIDRARLSSDHLFAHNPASSLAVPLFLSRLALHEKADFSLVRHKMFESRMPPCSPANGAARGHLLCSERLLDLFAAGGLTLRPDALCPGRLFADVLQAHGPHLQPNEA